MDFEWALDKEFMTKSGLEKAILEQGNQLIGEITEKLKPIYGFGKIYVKHHLESVKIKYRKFPWSLERITLVTINRSMNCPECFTHNIDCYTDREKSKACDVFKEIFSDYYKRIKNPDHLNVRLLYTSFKSKLGYDEYVIYNLKESTPVNPAPN